MKKIIIAMMLLVCSSSLFAQRVDGYGIPVNSLNVQTSDALVPYVGTGLVVGLGTAIGVGIGAAVAAVITGGNADIEYESPKMVGWMPYISIGYDHHFPNTRWSLGPELGYWHSGMVSETSYNHFHFATLTAASKLYYKPSGICKLYGGLNLGAALLASSTQTLTHATKADEPTEPAGDGATAEEPKSSDGPSIIPAIQFNPIGMRLGSEKVAFLAELGIGYKGFLQLGINVAL
jgi:hypothetical protein